MLSRVVVATLLVVLALFASTASAQQNSLIYIDNTDHFNVTLPTTAATYTEAMIYTGTGSMSFTLDWNGDLSDTVTFSIVRGPQVGSIPVGAGSLNITAVGANASYCSVANIGITGSGAAPAGTSVLLNSTHGNCTYVVTYAQFSGQVSLDYQNGITSSTVDIRFTPQVGTVGDPQFVGLRGQSYQVHGMDGAIYNVISDKNLQVNSRFTFLTEGQCPIIDGVADTNCWSHPGSYIGEMSFQQVVDGKLHAALITSGDAKSGFSMVQMDGKVVAIGASATFGSFSLTRNTAHSVSVQTEQFSFELTNSDFFINQALSTKVTLSKLHSHGLLGQTHSAKTYATPMRYIEGDVDDYVIADNDIFGDDFLFNKFQQ